MVVGGLVGGVGLGRAEEGVGLGRVGEGVVLGGIRDGVGDGGSVAVSAAFGAWTSAVTIVSVGLTSSTSGAQLTRLRISVSAIKNPGTTNLRTIFILILHLAKLTTDR
jgi:hypothetical protein